MTHYVSRRNYVIEAVKGRYQKEISSKHAEKIYRECVEHFTIFHVLNYCMYAEALEAFDSLEEKGLLKHKVKMLAKKCEMSWNKYQAFLKKTMATDAYGLIIDCCIQSHALLENELMYIRVASHNVFLAHKAPNADICARLVSAVCVGDVLDKLWVSYFKFYQKLCALDFSKYFQYANIQDVYKNIKNLFDELYICKDDIILIKDKAYARAYAAFGNKVSDMKFIDEAARKAISFSSDIEKQYQKDLQDIQEKKEDAIANILSEKYKVSRAK